MAMTSEHNQRIRIGVTGLAMVFLMVVIGSAISKSGEDGMAEANITAEDAPLDPLSEIGAAPGSAAEVGADQAEAQAEAEDIVAHELGHELGEETPEQ